MNSPRHDRGRAAGAMALLLVLSCSAWAQSPPADDPAREARAVAERFLSDWNEGRLADSYAAFSTRLQQIVTLTQLEASLVAVRNALGRHKTIADVRVAENRIDDRRAVVLDVTLGFERGVTQGVFTFVSERGAWRLRFIKLDLPLDKRPPLDDAPVATIAAEMLAVIQRDGLSSMVTLLPKDVREQFGEQAVRDLYERMADTMGPLRSHSLDKPTVLGAECRQLAGRARFEHGEATLRMALCPDQGVWRLMAIDVQPVMTPLLFERMARANLAQTLKHRNFELTCPATLVAVGAEASCRFSSGGRTRTARVRRIEDTDVEVVLAPE